MAEPFNRRSDGEGSVFSRLRGKGRVHALRELESRLAEAPSVRDVASSLVEEIGTRHGIDLASRLRTARLNLYRRFFEHCLLDQVLTEEESADLAHLRAILFLDARDVARVHEEVAHAVYGSAIDHVLEDQRLDPEEEEFLRRLREELDLPDDVAEQLYTEGAERARRRYLETSVAPGDFLLTSNDIVLELSGTSETSLEDAIQRTVDEAHRAVPGLFWVQLGEVGADVSEGRATKWHVKLKAKRRGDVA